MNQEFFTVRSNVPVCAGVHILTLEGDVSAFHHPGQFAELRLGASFFLRRPFSVFDLFPDAFSLAYKTVGAGTAHMDALRGGETLDVLTGLGNGFDLAAAGERPLLIGGGIGAAPLYLLCKRLLDAGKAPGVILGYNTAAEDYCADRFRALGADVRVTTADGTMGVRGFVTAAVDEFPDRTFLYACGPLPMLRAVEAIDGPGEVSMEARMGCGFGACMGCTIATAAGPRRVCKYGPVFRKGEIVW